MRKEAQRDESVEVVVWLVPGEGQHGTEEEGGQAAVEEGEAGERVVVSGVLEVAEGMVLLYCCFGELGALPGQQETSSDYWMGTDWQVHYFAV